MLNEFNIAKILARNLDKLKLDFPDLIFNGVELINGDISSTTLLHKADFVIHAAIPTNMNDYNDVSNNAGRNNIEKSVTYYFIIAHRHHYKSRILYYNSGTVYGKQP